MHKNNKLQFLIHMCIAGTCRSESHSYYKNICIKIAYILNLQNFKLCTVLFIHKEIKWIMQLILNCYVFIAFSNFTLFFVIKHYTV